MPSCFPSLRSAVVAALMLSVAVPPVAALDLAGPYLAARLATVQNDYDAAGEYYGRLLSAAPDNRDVQEGALITRVAVADYDGAVRIADQMLAAGDPGQIAVLVALAGAARSGDFAKGRALLDGGADGGALVSGLYRAWALAGEGQMAESAKAFDTVAKTRGLEGFAAYHRALSLAMVGDYEGADQIFSGPLAQVLHGTRRAIIAHAQILGQLERAPEAVAMIDDAFGPTPDPEIAALRAALEKGDSVPFGVVRNATDGLAETFLAVAQALNGEGPNAFTLVHARLANWLRPDLGDATVLSAAILEGQEQYDLAIRTYDEIAPDNPAYIAAAMGKAEAMFASERNADGIAALEDLSKSRADLPAVWNALGDGYRREERYRDAVGAYDRAVDLIAEPGPRDWFLFFARGISEHRSDQWDKAEKDFREALTLSPDQPSVLNYLGYSWIERKQNLDEALAMIERAVAARPDQGYIVDSLGWAFYQIGRYDEAVVQMEKAVELDPTEPLLNDHLGDVYWAVGRQREAEFQWHRALNLGPGEDLDMDRVRRKLEVGLDVVQQEEAAKGDAAD